jgi:hypothetical protein
VKTRLPSIVILKSELIIMNKSFFFKALCASSALAASLLSSAAMAGTLPMQTAVVLQPSHSSASRAEVKADLLVWRAAGMQQFQVDDADPFSDAYKKDYAEYVAVRTSPQFAQIERAIERGQEPKVTLTENPLRVSIALN